MRGDEIAEFRTHAAERILAMKKLILYYNGKGWGITLVTKDKSMLIDQSCYTRDSADVKFR